MKILLKIAYLGTGYCGYQVQPNGTTVQEKLNEAAKCVFGFDCDIIGCSRTDSGVHARGFCATVTKKGTGALETAVPTQRIPRAMNVNLPPDIAVLSAHAVPDDFHARYSVVSKEYEYLIYNGAERDPFFEGRAWHIPKRFDDAAVAAMHEAARCFVGKHDFTALRDGDPDEKDPVRHVFDASVTRRGDLISFRVRADGFLYHMVRVMTGTLVEVGRGRLSPLDVSTFLKEKNRKGCGATAPACGLYLDRVFYE